MKIRKRPLAGSQASVLMISLLLCVIMGISLASYLTLTRNQLFSVRRSQSWNASLSISEAGIEEGLCHINSPSSLNGIFASNGWTQQPDGSYKICFEDFPDNGEELYAGEAMLALNGSPAPFG